VWCDSFLCVVWLIHMCDVTHSDVWCDSFICVTWLIHMCGVTHSYVWLDSFAYVTWLMHMYDASRQLSKYVYDLRCVSRDGYLFVTWLIRMCAESQVYAWCDSFICVTWPIHIHDVTRLCATWLTHMNDVTLTWLLSICDMSHSYVCRVSCICVMGLIHTCDVTHSYVWCDSFICVMWLRSFPNVCIISDLCLTWLFSICDMAHSYECRDSHMCDVTHSDVWRDSSIFVTWLIHMCDVTHSHICVWLKSFQNMGIISNVCLTYTHTYAHMHICIFGHINIYKNINHFYMRGSQLEFFRNVYICVHDLRYVSHICTDSRLQIGWHRILRLFLKLCQCTSILPMGSTINIK